MCVNPISTLAVRGGRGDVMGIGLLIVLNFKLIFCPTLIFFSQLVNHNLVVNRTLSPFHNGLEHFLQDFISLTAITHQLRLRDTEVGVSSSQDGPT